MVRQAICKACCCRSQDLTRLNIMASIQVREFMHCSAILVVVCALNALFVVVEATKNVALWSIFAKGMAQALPVQRAEVAQVSAVSLAFRGVAQFDSSAALNPNGLAGLLGCFLSSAQQWGGLAVHGFSVIRPAQSFNHSS